MDESLKTIEKGWPAIKRSPWHFVGAVITLTSIVALALYWRYGAVIDGKEAVIHEKDAIIESKNSVIESKEATITAIQQSVQAMQQSLIAKDDLIAYHRERYGLLPATNRFSSYRNKELKEKTYKIVSNIRAFLGQWEKNWRKQFDQMWNERIQTSSSVTNQEERGKALDELSAKERTNYTEAFANLINDYNQQFRFEAILLRDELLSRLPKEAQPQLRSSAFEFVNNSFAVQEVADFLESLATKLPNGD